MTTHFLNLIRGKHKTGLKWEDPHVTLMIHWRVVVELSLKYWGGSSAGIDDSCPSGEICALKLIQGSKVISGKQESSQSEPAAPTCFSQYRHAQYRKIMLLICQVVMVYIHIGFSCFLLLLALSSCLHFCITAVCSF